MLQLGRSADLDDASPQELNGCEQAVTVAVEAIILRRGHVPIIAWIIAIGAFGTFDFFKVFLVLDILGSLVQSFTRNGTMYFQLMALVAAGC